MELSALYSSDSPVLSFELFPPATEKGMDVLKNNLSDLVSLNPEFMTCTYGAGGSTRDRTLDVLSEVRNVHASLPLATHLTCVGSTVEQLRKYLQKASSQGVEYIVALRGDPPAGDKDFKPVPGGLRYANELVSLIKEEFPSFGILVAGYPEMHQEAPDAKTDMDNLKRKVDAGADVILSQLFFNNEDFLRWRDDCTAAGISVPVVPGIFPVINFRQIQRITTLCGAKLPETFASRMEKYGDDAEGQFAVGTYYSTRQVEDLLEAGVPGIHFYVLNKSQATSQICRALSLGIDG